MRPRRIHALRARAEQPIDVARLPSTFGSVRPRFGPSMMAAGSSPRCPFGIEEAIELADRRQPPRHRSGGEAALRECAQIAADVVGRRRSRCRGACRRDARRNPRGRAGRRRACSPPAPRSAASMSRNSSIRRSSESAAHSGALPSGLRCSVGRRSVRCGPSAPLSGGSPAASTAVGRDRHRDLARRRLVELRERATAAIAHEDGDRVADDRSGSRNRLGIRIRLGSAAAITRRRCAAKDRRPDG